MCCEHTIHCRVRGSVGRSLLALVDRMSSAGRNAKTRGKVWERQVAKDFNTVRTGPTGTDDSDVVHDTLGIECKALARLAFRREHWEQAKRNAKGRVPVLVIKELNTGERIAITSYEYFVATHTKEN